MTPGSSSPWPILKKIIAIKGVVAEEIIMDQLERHGNLDGDLNTLARIRSRINNEFKSRGIESEMSKLKVDLRELSSLGIMGYALGERLGNHCGQPTTAILQSYRPRVA